MKGFKYDKFKEELGQSDSWGSYSDLFMVLSFVFLMMYVVASLRSGTSTIYEKIEKQKISRENEDLKAQMKAYETLKDQALAKESTEEQETYQELMDKLSLLQSEAKEEKLKLRRQAIENEKKEMALNKYQQIVRNIINANLLAKDKLKVREEIIDKKNDKIADLTQEVEEKQSEITKNNKEIAKIGQDLNRKISELNEAQKKSKITKEKAYKQIALLKKLSQEKINELSEQNKQAEQKVAEISQELSKTQEKVVVAENQNVKLTKDLEETSQKLESTVAGYEQQINDIQNNHQKKMQAERSAFEKRLKAAKLTAKEKEKQLAEFNENARRKDQEVNKQIMGLQSELADTKNREEAKAKENAALAQKLATTEDDYKNKIKGMQEAHEAKMGKERAAFQEKLRSANLGAEEKARQLAEFNRKAKEKEEAHAQEVASLKGSLAEAQERADARAKLARDIKGALKSAGVNAEVNGQTGDVVISFGNDFFDSGSADLKPGMRDVLKKFIPKYSEALLRDKKIAEKITAVEIIGFASPTYQNRYVDPNSLDPQDQKAAKYNLDLSYRRARSIFDDIFDTNKHRYTYQKDLLSKVKVSGRSFFNDGRTPAGVTPGMNQRKFCEVVDCKKAQTVIIKFNMDEKK